MFSIHKIIPKKYRKIILKSRLAKWAFKSVASGHLMEVSWLGNKFYFDAYRNFGFATVSLDSIESAQRNFAKKYISEFGCKSAWDVGANIGYWTVSLADMMGRDFNIISIEPDKKNIVFLKKNIAALEGRIDILNVALSSRVGTALLNTDETGALNSIETIEQVKYTGRETIDIETIDSVVGRYGSPDFIKLDVEGHEYEVIQGAIALLKEGKTIWLVELTNNGDALIELVRKNGHTVVNMLGDEISWPEYYVGVIPNRIHLNSQSKIT